MVNQDQLLQIATTLFKLTNKSIERDKNILYENSKNDENWHSRILRMLLEYHIDNSYPILGSFINLLKKDNNLPIKDLNEYSQPPYIYYQRENIDILIRIENDAIIIENKINWASDQEQQIERYIKSVISDPNIENVYVIYLTSDGTKQVAEYSYTEEAKRLARSFIPLNYKDHILPWLRELQGDLNNQILSSSLVLYIDYLSRMFEQPGKDQITITNQLLEEMNNNKINLDSLEACFNIVEGASKLLDELTKIKEDKIKKTAEDHIKKPLEEEGFLKELDLNLDKAEFSLNHFDIVVSRASWKKCEIHISIWQYKIYGGLAYKDPNSPLSNEVLKQLEEMFPNWKGDDNEPRWTYFSTDYRNYWNLDTWKKIENDQFVEYIRNFIKDINDKVKNIEL